MFMKAPIGHRKNSPEERGKLFASGIALHDISIDVSEIKHFWQLKLGKVFSWATRIPTPSSLYNDRTIHEKFLV